MSNLMTQATPLRVGDRLVSQNQRFFATLQNDGNFVVYEGNGSLTYRGVFAGNTAPNPASNDYMMWLQTADGNLVVYDGNAVSWASNVLAPGHLKTPDGGQQPYYGVMQDDGVFCLYEGTPVTDANPVGNKDAYWHTTGAAGMDPRVWNYPAGKTPDETREVVLKAISAIPKVGAVLSTLASIFWTDDTTVFDQVKAQVEALVKQSITDAKYQDVSDALKGVKDELDIYHSVADAFNAAPTPDQRPTDMAATFRAAESAITTNMPTFQSSGYEVVLLPLFAQLATMHLYLYRDAVQFGVAWGLKADTEVAPLKAKLLTLIDQYGQYAQKWYANGLPSKTASQEALNSQAAGGSGSATNSALRAYNDYVAYMTVSVLDIQDLWQYAGQGFDAPLQTTKLTREITSGPFGTTQVYTETDGDYASQRLSVLDMGYTTNLVFAKHHYTGAPGLSQVTPTDAPVVTMANDGEGVAACRWVLKVDDDPIVGFSLYMLDMLSETVFSPAFLTRSGKLYPLFSQAGQANLEQVAGMTTIAYPGHVLSRIVNEGQGYELRWRRDDSY